MEGDAKSAVEHTGRRRRRAAGTREIHTMTTRAQRDFLKVQLVETQHLKKMAADHPLMSVSFAEREKELVEKIAALPLGNKEARTVLFFSGGPVQGSVGIDAS